MSAIPVRRAIVDALLAHGVPFIVGNPGSTEVPILDELVDVPQLPYVLTLHEAVAVAIGDGFARLARRPAVVSVHATPGVSNIIGGLFLAQSHRSPLVVLAGQQDSRLLGRRAFLASDLVAQTRQYTKMATQPAAAEDVIPAILRGFEVAMEVPRGPVLIVVPRDFLSHEVEYRRMAGERTRRVVGTPSDDEIDSAARLIAGSRRPVIFSGNAVGAVGGPAISRVVKLAELLGAPVYSEHNATNMHFPSGHPQYLAGNAHGIAGIRPWLRGADLLIAVGCDLFMEDRYLAESIIPPSCRVVQIDEDPAEIGRVVPVAAGLVGDLERTLDALIVAVRAVLGPEGLAAARRRAVGVRRRRHARDRKLAALQAALWDASPIRMPRLYAELRAAMPSDAILVDEAVNMASYLHAYFPLSEPDTLLSSKQSWLGWGWGAALGARLAYPNRRVVACLGDGSASYSIQALWTAQRYRLPIATVIVDNGGYMAVENHLRQFGGRALARRVYPGTELGDIDFVSLARGYGVPGMHVEEPGAIGPALRWAMGIDGPALVQVRVDPDDAGLGRAPIPRPQTGGRIRGRDPKVGGSDD